MIFSSCFFFLLTCPWIIIKIFPDGVRLSNVLSASLYTECLWHIGVCTRMGVSPIINYLNFPQTYKGGIRSFCVSVALMLFCDVVLRNSGSWFLPTPDTRQPALPKARDMNFWWEQIPVWLCRPGICLPGSTCKPLSSLGGVQHTSNHQLGNALYTTLYNWLRLLDHKCGTIKYRESASTGAGDVISFTFNLLTKFGLI